MKQKIAIQFSFPIPVCHLMEHIAEQMMMYMYMNTVLEYRNMITYTVSTRLDAHLTQARNPLFGPKVGVKYEVTQSESCLSISPSPLFALDLLGNALCVYACGYSISRLTNVCSLSYVTMGNRHRFIPYYQYLVYYNRGDSIVVIIQRTIT